MRRILVIEGDGRNAELMTSTLASAGLDVFVAPNAAAGMAHLENDSIDLIVCNIHLEDVRGRDFARKLKDDARWRCVPLLALVELSAVADCDDLLAAGFSGYLPLPIDPTILKREIEVLLFSEHRSSQAIAESRGLTPIWGDHEGRGRHVLIVDDTRANLDLMWTLLAPLGYELTLATCGREARALMRQNRFDLVITDLSAYPDDTLWLIHEIAVDPQAAATPFLIATSSATRDMEHTRAAKLHKTFFIERPIGPRKVIDAIKSALTLNPGTDGTDGHPHRSAA